MDRRKVLLAVAAVIAALGTLLVFLYVRGADTRADERYEAVQVLRVVKQIEPGETVEAAQAAGKFETSSVSQKDLLPDALTTTEGIAGKVAITTLYPGEQLISSKFGATGSGQRTDHPQGQDRDLGQPDRPGPRGRLREPRGQGRHLHDRHRRRRGRHLQPAAAAEHPGHRRRHDDHGRHHHDRPEGVATTDQLPKTLLTVAVTQAEAERVLYAASNGELSFGLLNNDSKAAASKGVTNTNLFKAP